MNPIPFGEWLPDQPTYGNSGLLTATNCYPGVNGYRPVGSFVQYVPAGPNKFLGGATFTAPRGENIIIAGSSNNLYRVIAGAWASIASGYTTLSGGRWRFAQFGGLAIATNDANPMQKIDLVTGAVNDLGGNPPTFRMLAVVRDFLVGGVMDGKANQLGWSAINNAEDWTFGQNQSDYQIMPSGGDINGLFGGEYGLILQRNRITRLDYTGGEFIFAVSEISTNFGCVSPHSVIQHGQIGCFLSDNGFMMWDGGSLVPIGSEKVDRTFLKEYGKSDWQNMSAAVDIGNQVFKWSMGDRIFCYHWLLKRWTVIEQPAQIIFSGVTRSISVDEDDPNVPGDSDMDAAGALPWDDLSYIGGDNAFYVIDQNRVLGRLIGPPMEAKLGMSDLELSPGRETILRWMRVDTDAMDGVTLTVDSRGRLGEAPMTANFSEMSGNGDMPTDARARYFRFTLTIAAGTDWTFAQSLQPDTVIGAKR